MKCHNWCAALSLWLCISVCASDCVRVTALTVHFVLACSVHACAYAHVAMLCMCSVSAGCCFALYVYWST